MILEALGPPWGFIYLSSNGIGSEGRSDASPIQTRNFNLYMPKPMSRERFEVIIIPSEQRCRSLCCRS
jgi:hypothetical protein